ncbi:MAG TPA: flagellar assembly protein FliW [Bacteroidota bacterium]|nr:flagellar assembly protein FliW [Bacteroidota bacterium]
MKCFNRQFGEIDYENEHVYEFAEGLIGFEHLRKFIVLKDPSCEPFQWLVSVEDEDISFPILNPAVIIEDYRIVLPDENCHVAVVAALKDPVEQSTVNLRSPIVFDTVKRTGRQVVLEEEVYAIHHPLVPQCQPAHEEQQC